MIKNLFLSFVEDCIRNISGPLGRKVRYWYYRKRFAACGKNVIIEPGVFFQDPNFIFLGDDIWIDKYAVLVAGSFKSEARKFLEKPNENFKGQQGQLIINNGSHIAPYVLLQSHGGLSVGEGVTIASGAKVYTLSHHYKNLKDPLDQKRYSFSSMAAKEDQFLIVSPVVVGDGCAVGLNSVILPGTTISNGTWLGVLTHVESQQTDSNSIYSSTAATKK